MVSIGRRPLLKGLDISSIGLDERDFVENVDVQTQSLLKYPHIKPIGDVTLGPMLALKAEEQAIRAIQSIGCTGSDGTSNCGLMCCTVSLRLAGSDTLRRGWQRLASHIKKAGFCSHRTLDITRYYHGKRILQFLLSLKF
ncbi:Irc15p [Saccharomyces cerevisiae]|nr:Irc15p [Saccharomyces cerevisiae]